MAFLRDYNILLSFADLNVDTLDDFFELVTRWLPGDGETYVFFLHLDEVCPHSQGHGVYTSSVESSVSFSHVSLPTGTRSLGMHI